MQEFLNDRAKTRAIAIFTFNSIVTEDNQKITAQRFKQAIQQTFQHFDIHINQEEMTEIIGQVDRFQKGFLDLEDFCEAFDKILTVYMKAGRKD